jgi:hypothetical protein
MRHGVVIFLLLGCGTTYEPKTSGTIRNVAPPGFAPKGSISFVNAQASKDEIKIGQDGSAFEPITVDLHAWTEVVIRYARDLVPAGAGISKQITVKILGAKLFNGAYAGPVVVSRPTCDVDLEVQAGNGYHAVFHGQAKNLYSGGTDACDDATREVTAQVFQDFQILKYLTE